ncbi:MAG TPA: hypothetical protein VK665_13010, partial [Candidatus Elarobacter sp.]|nr:hypothetical protein [Candidatus Elarobacter sp.]
TPAGRYDYARGWNLRAIAALIVGWIPPLIGKFYAPLGFLWSGGWFFSIIVAGLAYAWFMRTSPSRITEPEYDAITAVEPTALDPALANVEVTPA